LSTWEVNDLIDIIAADISAAYSKPGNLASELLHRAAFSGGLSQALLPDPARLGSIKAEALHEYVAAVIKPGNLALTGAGVSLTALNKVRGRRGGGGGGGGGGRGGERRGREGAGGRVGLRLATHGESFAICSMGRGGGYLVL
jgi:hypothetical protein